MSAVMDQPSEHSTNSREVSESFKSPELLNTPASIPPSEASETTQAPEAPKASSLTGKRLPEELRRPITLYNSVTNLLKQHKCLATSGTSITCRACMTDFKFTSRKGTGNIVAHMKSKIHEKNLQNFNLANEYPGGAGYDDENGPPLGLAARVHRFHIGLLRWFIGSGIPLEKVDLAPFKEFADKYFPFRILDSVSYKTQYSRDIQKIQTELNKH